jgi:lipopolysaccharide export system permease protein
MRILDSYLLKRFASTFFSAFAIVLFIFIFQAIWLFIDELAGKDLDITIIGKFLIYYLPTIVDDVMPLAVLLTSILTYGSLAEYYEFAAIKASGISLFRAMRSTLIFSIVLAIATFFVANNIIPASEQKIFNLRRNIAQVKPSAAIVEGIFTDIENTDMTIKVGQKYGDNDRLLKDVLIHQKSENQQNTVVISATSGEFISNENSNLLELVLYDGYYYEEILPSKAKDRENHPFARANFDTYVKYIDLSSLNEVDLDKESSITTDKMKPMRQLLSDIDSLRINNDEQIEAFTENTLTRIGALDVGANEFLRSTNDGSKALELRVQKGPKPTDPDSIFFAKLSTPKDSILRLIPSWQRSQALKSARNNLASLKITVAQKGSELGKRFEFYNRHIIQLHKKFALALSCILLFFIGAPMGALIRKGGLGLPMVIAIIFFLSYHFLGVFAENYAKRGNIHPIIGAWFSTFVMLPIAFYLSRLALLDRGLIAINLNIFKPIARLFKGFKK